ncbi:MAG: 16S rRNA (guanine(966)-N(2))-methyltransferase RsmD [Nitrospirae bacterium]|nr:16S rRNA (guanine(966)-N(2))-methyltransferase RsmD [Nitrospirota bacterium]
MRIIAGSQKGRRLLGPKGAGLRPTSDRVKEALFAILGPRIVGARFLDLYAGTGAVGIEALSRGAQQVTFVEPNPDSLRVLRANLDRCGLLPVADIHACSAEVFLRRRASQGSTYDVVFADPPYRIDSGRALLPSLGLGAIITLDSIVVLEHFTKVVVPPRVGRLTRLRQYRHGDTTLSVFGVNGEGADSP